MIYSYPGATQLSRPHHWVCGNRNREVRGEPVFVPTAVIVVVTAAACWFKIVRSVCPVSVIGVRFPVGYYEIARYKVPGIERKPSRKGRSTICVH